MSIGLDTPGENKAPVEGRFSTAMYLRISTLRFSHVEFCRMPNDFMTQTSKYEKLIEFRLDFSWPRFSF
jgi:hypothetical protein